MREANIKRFASESISRADNNSLKKALDGGFEIKQDGPEPLDSMEDIAARLNCHKRTIARIVAKGELKPIRFNSRLIRFRRSEVDAWILRSQGVSL